MYGKKKNSQHNYLIVSQVSYLNEITTWYCKKVCYNLENPLPYTLVGSSVSQYHTD